MTQLSASAALAATALLVACGSETKVTHDPDPQGSGGGGGEVAGTGGEVGGSGGTGATGGTGGTGGDGASGGGGGGTSGIGELRIVHEPGATSMSGAFSHEPPPYCVVQATEGGCSFLICDYDIPGPPLLDAGPITISGATQPIVMSFDPALDAYLYEVDAAVVAPGQTLAVDVAGSADVPAFSGTVEVPSVGQLTAPDLSNVSIDLAQPLDLAWTAGGVVGEVEVRVVTPGPAMEDAYALLCRYPAGDGAATIPASMLGNLVPTADEGAIGVALVETAELLAGGWTLEVSVGAWMTSASSANGYAFAQDIVIQ